MTANGPMTNEPKPDPETAARVCRVVIVEDSPDDRAEIRRLLLRGSERRYRFVEAETAAAGVRAALDAAAGPPDCVVLDYSLPDGNALEVLAALAGPDGLTVCPVVVLTGTAGHEQTRAVLRAGAQDYVGKGWMTPESLTRSIENATERWAMARELRGSVAALQASEERFRLAARVAGLAVAEIDYATGLIHLSPEAAVLFGLPAEPAAVPRAVVHALFHPDDRAALAERIAACYDPAGTGEFALEHRIVRPDGRVRWHNVRKQVFFAGGRPARALLALFDITARKESEQKLKASEERFRLAAEALNGIIYEYDFRTGHVERTRGLYEVVGYRPDEVPPTAVWWREQTHPDDRGANDKLYANLVGDSVANEYRVRHRDGRWLHVEDRAVLLRGDDGKPMKMVGCTVDVTARKQAEEARQEAQWQTATTLESITDGFTRFDRDWRVVYMNDEAERINQRPRADTLGKTVWELFPALLGTKFETEYRRCVAEQVAVEFDYHYEPWDQWFMIKCYPTPEGGLVVYFRDITDRKRAQDSLRTNEERLRMALGAAEAGAWAWELSTGVIAWSPENYALYGYDPAGRSPAYADWQERVHPDDRGRANAAVTDALASRTPEFRHEFRIVHPGRGERWLLGLGRVEFSATGEPLRMVGINLDITDRKRAEQLLAEQDVRRDEFLATLAHELRNPLAPIRSGVAVLRRTRAPEQTEKTLGMIDRQLGHMVDLVDDLLDVSRVRSGKITLRSERVALRDAVDAAVEACRPTIDAKGHSLETTFPAESLEIDGDKTRLVQVVANLLTNAAKYSEPGGRIRVAVGRDGGEAVVRVSDTGMGIAPETIPTLWDMFTQVRDTLDKAQGGLGIGLSLVKKLVEMHGGTVGAESAGVGHGSTFIIRLPIAASAAEPPPDPSPERNGTSGPVARRVLVVDDNVDGAESLAMLLEISGHETRTVHTGLAALAAARAFDPDVVFLDIGLPAGMDGYEVARRLRADPDTAGTVLVALTGWGSADDKQRSKDAGFDIHLTKPVEPAAVTDVLSRFATLSRRGFPRVGG